MRERPSVRLAEVSSLGKVIPSNYNVVATDTAIEGRVLGTVYKDPTAIKARMVWASVVRGEGGESIYIGHHGTRQKATLMVAEKWAQFQAENEAYEVLDAITLGHIAAINDAERQRGKNGDEVALVTPAGRRLSGTLSEVRAMGEYVGRQIQKRLQGAMLLDLDTLKKLAHTQRMVELEIERRERQEAKPTRSLTREDARSYLDALSSERIQEQTEAFLAMPGIKTLLSPADGALVRSIHEHLSSPWKLTPSVMKELLDAVRQLEKQALEAQKSRPATMVVKVENDVLERLTKLEQQNKVLRARTTMLLAGVVTALDEDEKAMLSLLKRTFAMGPDDISEEV